MHTHQRVGTVEILVTRIYPIDPNHGDNSDRTTVVVEPGTYPVFRVVDAFYRMMSGRINGRGFTKIGDGMSEMREGDSPGGPEVTFPSRMYGAEQFREFLAEPLCTEGDRQQRMRFVLSELVQDKP